MSKVITFSRTYPSYHPKAGQPTYFVEKMLRSIFDNKHQTQYIGNLQTLKTIGGYAITSLDLKPIDFFDPKHHTIRAGHRFKAGDWFSPRVWSGKPYNSKQIQFAPDIQVKKVWGFEISEGKIFIEKSPFTIHSAIVDELAKNDGLSNQDLKDWFRYPKPFEGQIICWGDVEY